jgi:hypothetical protein
VESKFLKLIIKRLLMKIFLFILVFLSFSAYLNAENYFDNPLGPWGGNINSIVCDSSDNIIIGTEYAGFYKLDKKMNIWEEMNSGFEKKYDSYNVLSTSVCSNGDIYAAIYRKGLFIYGNDAKWGKVDIDIGEISFAKLKSYDDQLYILSKFFSGTPKFYYIKKLYNGIFKKEEILIPNLHVLNVIDFIAVDNNNFFVALYNGMIKTTDKGNSWNDVIYFKNTKIDLLKKGSINEEMFAVSGSRMFRSENDGEEWFTMNTPDVDQINDIISISKNEMIIATNNGIYYSDNAGISWDMMNSFNSTVLLLKNNILYGNIPLNGIYKGDIITRDFDKINPYINNCLIHTTFVVKEDNIYVKYDRKILKYNESENKWEIFVDSSTLLDQLDDGFSINDIDFIGDLIYLCSSKGVFVSEDNGISWSRKNFGLSNFYTEEIVFINENEIFLNTTISVFRTSLEMDYWEEIPINDLPDGERIRNIHKTDHGILAGTWKYGLWFWDIEKESWVFAGLEGKCIKSIETFDDTIYCSYYTFGDDSDYEVSKALIFDWEWEMLSSDGNSIESIANNILSLDANKILINYNNIGLYEYDTKIQDYSFVNPDTFLKIYDMLYHNNKIYFSTSRGLYIQEYMTKVFEEVSNSELHIYPNPVINDYELNFSSDFTGELTIIISDNLGNEIHRISHNKQSGELVLPLSSELLVSGTYFYSILAGERTLSSGSFTVIK